MPNQQTEQKATEMIDSTVRAERLQAVRNEMVRESIDMVAVGATDNSRYLLGFSTHPDERFCVLLASAEHELMVVPALNAEQVSALVPELPLIRWSDEDGPFVAIREALSTLGVSGRVRIAVDQELRADHLLQLQAELPDATATSAIGVIGPVRETKDELELALLKASAEMDDEAMQAAFAAVRVGMTEQELAEVVGRCYQGRGGATEFAIVGGGPNSAFPHHETGQRTLREGDAVVLDIGGRLNGYPSDMTRMAYLGEPSDRYLEVHAIVEAAVAAGIAAAQPGATCAQVDAAARTVIADAGYGEYFTHRTGHGLGISVHEAPWIMAGNDEPLRVGAVHSVEPGIYLPGEFGVRLEDVVYVTGTGAERLSKLPREAHIVAV